MGKLVADGAGFPEHALLSCSGLPMVLNTLASSALNAVERIQPRLRDRPGSGTARPVCRRPGSTLSRGNSNTAITSSPRA